MGGIYCRRASNNKLMIIQNYLSSSYPNFYYELSVDRFDIGQAEAFAFNLSKPSLKDKLHNLDDTRLKELLLDKYFADVGCIFFSLGAIFFFSLLILVL
ncbi:hypothetical protein JL49_04060 [Pseudoalteromonas luteoviolacea]|uniref:Uncharacterized protein n=1 Tax=Pseudoalteromonas luteoviolacea NCIMB 1942 TaxID=1365253 RepID=A0A166YZ86_9GAMM|nr:hypothetical protein N482_03130 [Pseudoalteromonas luteoviolacea NCIMB 1942]KZX01796.1 hypothetical protein JL49_04060 [Pseudoalteromonas luteoviolacea]